MSHRPSPLDAEPCRQCSSFTDYVKLARKKIHNITNGEKTTESTENREEKTKRDDCPLYKEELGNKTWGLLHTIAAKYPERPSKNEQTDIKDFFSVLSRIYPCDHCARDLREELKIDPPQTESQEKFSQWLCRLHNKVNVKLGKSEFDCSKVNERWRDGWLDGSCD